MNQDEHEKDGEVWLTDFVLGSFHEKAVCIGALLGQFE